MLTQDQILKLLETNDKAVARALVVLYNNQTDSEQANETTNQWNGKGFSHAHAFIGTRMAKFYMNRGFLTPKQIAYWRKNTPSGKMRIGMYWKQLQQAAEQKVNAK